MLLNAIKTQWRANLTGYNKKLYFYKSDKYPILYYLTFRIIMFPDFKNIPYVIRILYRFLVIIQYMENLMALTKYSHSHITLTIIYS